MLPLRWPQVWPHMRINHRAWRQKNRPSTLISLILCIALLYSIAWHTDHLPFSAKHKDYRELAAKLFPPPNTPFFPPSPFGCSDLHNNSVDTGSLLDTIPQDVACANFPGHLLSHYQIVLKTGAAERDRTENLLAAFGACIPNLLIVSDAPDHIAGHEVVDVLATLPSSYAAANPADWMAYQEHLAAQAAGEDVPKSHAGWKLDRLKFLPMVDVAYARASPDTRWYVFIEADNYIFWDTLFRLLERLDPDAHHYLGSATPGARGVKFAYGGGGAVLSRGLMQDLLRDGRQQIAVKYQSWATNECCGDALLAYVIKKELGTRLQDFDPVFTGEELGALGVTAAKSQVPILSLHRVGTPEMRALWKWERCRPYDEMPITHASVSEFIFPEYAHEEVTKQNWNSLADRRRYWYRTLKTCASACKASSKCLAYSFAEGKCRFTDSISRGRPYEGMTSGWFLEKLDARWLPLMMH